MTSQSDLFPLFSDIAMSFDDATAIVGAMYDIAEVDGTHVDELQLIHGFSESLAIDLGEEPIRAVEKMTPEKLAVRLGNPALRKVALQCAVLLAWADGSISDAERRRMQEYASALGFTPQDYEAIEKTITTWVKAGDFIPILS